MIDGIIDAVPLLIAAIPQIIAAIVTGLITGLPKILTAAGKLVTTIINKIKELPTLIPQAIAAGVEKIAEWGANMQEKGGTVITDFVTKVSGRRIRHGAGSNTYPDRRGSGSRRGRKRQNSPYTFQSGKSGLQGNCAGTHRHRGRNDNRRHCSTERSIKAV